MDLEYSTAQIYLIPCTIAPDTQQQVIPEQTRQVLLQVNYYLVENVRTARRFIASLKIRDVSTIDFKVLDKRTSMAQLDELLVPLKSGYSVGIISEAGCPAIADPGNKVVTWAHQHGIKVAPLVGPSSILLALMGSGLNGQHFEFHGYLPIDKIRRAKTIKYLEQESSKTGKCQIFMETPYRNRAMAESLLKYCQGDTLVCFAVELTSKNERILTKTVNQWKRGLPELHKKPVIFLIQANSSNI